MGNKLNRLGFIIFSYREREGLSLDKFAHFCGISIRYLRDLEAGIKFPNDETLKRIFCAMKYDTKEMENDTLEIESLINSLLKSLIYVERENNENLFNQLLQKEKIASSLLIFPDFLLGCLAQYVFIENSKEAQKILDIIDRKELFDVETLQLFHLYKGIHYKNIGKLDQAVLYYKEALRVSGNESIIGMIHYHIAIVYTKQMKELSAFDHNLKAKEYFSRSANTIRGLFVVNHLGILYSHNKEYDLAEANLLHFLNQAEMLGLKKEMSKACHNLIRLYVLWGKEKLAIDFAEKTVKTGNCKIAIYYYACWAHYKLGNINAAVEWWHIASKRIDNKKVLISAFSDYMGRLLGLNEYDEIECLKKINQYVGEQIDYNDRILFKKLLAKAAEEINDKQLELKCYKEITELLMEHSSI